MLIGSDWLPNLDLSWWLALPCCTGAFGLLLLFLVLRVLGSTRILMVPPGEEPDRFYRHWKANKWHKRYSRGFFFLAALALGMTLGGCTGAILMVAL